MATPGSSPSVCVKTTPASSALAFRIGPISESSSAFTITTGLPYLNASSTTLAPKSTVPVTSTIRSIASQRVRTVGSSVITGMPRSMRAAASTGVSAVSHLRDSSLLERALSVLRRSIGHAGQAHARHRCAELQGDCTARCAGADNAYPNRLAVVLARPQYAVNGCVVQTALACA